MTGAGTSENAVSPVVGVMLMLAVTVMLAAVVSSYAGGFSEGSQKSPQSSLKVSADMKENRILFDHYGGDPFTIDGIVVVLQGNSTKISLTTADVPEYCRNFTEIGAEENDRVIKPGDSFYLADQDPESTTTMKFGTMILANNTELNWRVIDKGTSKAIAVGSLYL